MKLTESLSRATDAILLLVAGFNQETVHSILVIAIGIVLVGQEETKYPHMLDSFGITLISRFKILQLL